MVAKSDNDSSARVGTAESKGIKGGKVVRRSKELLKGSKFQSGTSGKAIGRSGKSGKSTVLVSATKSTGDSKTNLGTPKTTDTKGTKLLRGSKEIVKSSGKASESSGRSTAQSTKSGKVLGKSKEIVKQPRRTVKAGKKSIGQAIKADKSASSEVSRKLTRDKKSIISASVPAEGPSSTAARGSRKLTRQPEKVSGTTRESVARAAKSRGNKAASGTGKFVRESRVNIGRRASTQSIGGKTSTRFGEGAQRREKGTRTGGSSNRVSKRADLRSSSRTTASRSSLFTRPANEGSFYVRPAKERSQHIRTESRKGISESRAVGTRSGKLGAARHGGRRWKEGASRVYRERSSVARDVRRHEHVYVDYHDHVHRTIVWPGYRFSVYYNWGPWWTFNWCYPYYHRRYVFVSLGGYWPCHYSYLRYYWYGCHPYDWYGYYPIAREVQGDTYNYYTYNYYDDGGTSETCDIAAVDPTTFADVRERLAQAPAEPGAETLADRYFEDAVEAFEAGDYDLAAELFAKAMELAPDDMILPFAYCQALFAGERYSEAAEVLRQALAKVSPEKEGVFYPRGLYTDEDILFDQIDKLAEKAKLYSFDGDLQLLLGYHLLGIGELDAALDPLCLANQDLENASPAAVLLSLVEKMRVETAEEAAQEL